MFLARDIPASTNTEVQNMLRNIQQVEYMMYDVTLHDG